MNKLPLSKRLEILCEQLVRARIHYDLWWFLEGEDSFPLIRDTLNDYSEFFLVDTNAHFTNMIIRSAVVWDSRDDCISLLRVAKDILDPVRFPEHKEILNEIKKLRKGAAGILEIRHKAIAHVTERADRKQIFVDAGIIPAELPNMMDSWLAATNRLRAIHDANLPAIDFRSLPLHHLQALVRKLGGPDLQPRTCLDEILKA